MIEEKKYASLRASLAIDQLQLDQDLINHASFLMDAADVTASAASIRDDAKNALDIATATAADRLRRELVPDGPQPRAKKGEEAPPPTGKRRSEAQILSEIPLDKKVQEALTDFDDAKFGLALWTSLVDAYRARGSMLKHLAELITSGYMTPNAVQGGRREEVAARRREMTPRARGGE